MFSNLAVLSDCVVFQDRRDYSYLCGFISACSIDEIKRFIYLSRRGKRWLLLEGNMIGKLMRQDEASIGTKSVS